MADSLGATATGTVAVNLIDDPAQSQNLTSIAMEAAPGGGTQAHVTFAGIPRRTYRIQSTDILASGIWQTLATVTADATGRIEFIDLPPLPPTRFYRTITP